MVENFYGVDCIVHPANLQLILVHHRKLVPIAAAGLDAQRIFRTTFLLQVVVVLQFITRCYDDMDL